MFHRHARITVAVFRLGPVRKYSVPVDIPVPRKSKIWDSVDEAVKDVKSGDVLLCGGS